MIKAFVTEPDDATDNGNAETFENKNGELDGVNFYGASRHWLYDQYHSQTIWLRRALVAVIALAILLGLSLSANLALLPLKEKVPFLYAFDHATGEVTQVGELEPSKLSSNWALTRYFLIRYVINREHYDSDNIETSYQIAWAMSDSNTRQQFEAETESSSSHSPINLYGKDKFITVKFISMNKLNDNTIEMKFEKTLHDRVTNTEQTSMREAIIKWQYAAAQTTQKMLDRDPLGFKVTYYNVTQVN